MFWAEIWKISEFFIWKIAIFLVVKFSVYLNRRVFVMCSFSLCICGSICGVCVVLICSSSLLLVVPREVCPSNCGSSWVSSRICVSKEYPSGPCITKTRLFKYIENFTSKIWKNIQIKNSDIFHISAQNIDCGYSLEPPRRGGSNEYHNLCFWAEIGKIMYTPVNPSFTI